MVRIKLAYIGGGSTRAAGTMASFVHQGENFNGSEVVLINHNGMALYIARLFFVRRIVLFVLIVTDLLR